MSRGAALCLLACLAAAPARAGIVERGYFPLPDGTLLNYTLTLPSREGRYPTVLQYDPYAAGVTSDPTWNDAGYAMLGVNFRGTGCSQGTFRVARADLWGADGAQVVDWAARQAWSDGTIGMIGYSFTGVSQLATAAFAGEALKAIAPGNVFPDLYRDIIYPGGVFNQWLPLWILIGRAFVGNATLDDTIVDPVCAAHVLQALPGNSPQTADLAAHPYLDEYWATQPSDYLERVRIPVLGCVNWQDTTVYSRAANMFRDELAPDTTWMVAANGAHADCPISRARLVRFFDRYLKHQDNDWESTPHVLLIHELAGEGGVRESLDDDAGAWRTGYAQWSDLAAATVAVTLHLHPGGRLESAPPVAGAVEAYRYPLPSANTPADWAGLSAWNLPAAAGGALVYTTAPLAHDAEFAGSGSVDLWIASTADDADVQATLSEVRPDGQEMYVQNGWLRLSHRRLDEARSTPLRPYHTHHAADAEPLIPGVPVFARVELQPFNHVFRQGSAIRLTVDAPGAWMRPLAAPATNSLHLGPAMGSTLVLGWLPGRRAPAPLPACGTLLNQPCRPNAQPVPAGTLALDAETDTTPARTNRFGGAISPFFLFCLWLLRLRRRRAPHL